MLTPLTLAKKFHDLSEDIAPRHGYVSRLKQAFDPESTNGKTMIAVCEKLMAEGSGIGICDLNPDEKIMAPGVIVEVNITFTKKSTIDIAITKHRLVEDKALNEIVYSMAKHAHEIFSNSMGKEKPRIQLLSDPRTLN